MIWKYGEIGLWLKMAAVEDENQEIALYCRLQKIEPDFEVGEDVSEEVKLVDLGRRTVSGVKTKSSL